MYAIYGNIYHHYTPNVSIYTIHGFLYDPMGYRLSNQRIEAQRNVQSTDGRWHKRRHCSAMDPLMAPTGGRHPPAPADALDKGHVVSSEIFQGEELSAYGIGENGNVVIHIT